MMLRDEVEMDSASQNESESVAVEVTETTQPAYTSGALIENQPKLIDFVPTRVFLVTGIFLMLVAVVTMLNIAHFKILPFANARGISAGALELSLDRGLLSWVASFLLLATALFCFQVFQVRRFRADDFSGSYRVWIWLAVGFVLASVDATARVSPIIAALIAGNWESGFLSVDRNVWLVLVGLPAALVCIRLVIEIWRSRVAIGSIGIAALAYVVANLVRLDFIPLNSEEHAVVEANSVLVAHSFLFFTIVVYARFVLLESQETASAQSLSEERESIQKTDSRRSSTRTGSSEKVDQEDADQQSERSSSRPLAKRLASGKNKKRKQVEPDPVQLENEELGDEEAGAPTLKLMGQAVQNKKGNRKRKSGQPSRRRAA